MTGIASELADYLTGKGWSGEGVRLAALKFELLTSGMRITPEADAQLFRAPENTNYATEPLRTRSGVSGGLDIALSKNLFVNVPVVSSEKQANITLHWDVSSGFYLDNSLQKTRVRALQRPSYYSLALASGIPMKSIAQMCSNDRLCYSITGPQCRFWSLEQRCKYCSIGMNSNDDSLNRNIVDFLEIVNRAINDSIRPARHILLGGGTPNSPDMGAREIAEITKAIKSNHDVSVYAMIAAPLENASIDILHDSGVDELGINLEFWSEEAWSNLIPGKNKIIGKKRYLEAISHLGKVFGRVRSRSIMVAGLESASETLNGVKHLVDAGVMPILSPFRALSGTIMERAEGFSSREYQILYVEAARIAAKAALPIGPACIPCMNNVLALPEDDPCSVKQQLE